jgi:general secretion pathway protein I
MRARGGRSRRGFSLLEVLVATTIMAVAVVTLLSALTMSLRNASALMDSDKAAMLGKQTLDALLVETNLPPGEILQGQFKPLETGLTGGWRARVEPFETVQGVRGRVDRIAVEIWWQRGLGRRTMQLEAFRRAPTAGLQ